MIGFTDIAIRATCNTVVWIKRQFWIQAPWPEVIDLQLRALRCATATENALATIALQDEVAQFKPCFGECEVNLGFFAADELGFPATRGRPRYRPFGKSLPRVPACRRACAFDLFAGDSHTGYDSGRRVGVTCSTKRM